MPRPRKDARVLKRWIERRGKWRVVACLPDGRRVARDLGAEADADRLVAQLEARLARANETTVERAVLLYSRHLAKKGNKPGSIEDTLYRLRTFFGPVLKVRVSSLSATRCQELYAGKWDGDRLLEHGLVTRPTSKKRDAEGRAIGPPLAVDSQRNILLESKTFGRWWVSQGWAGESPLEEVKADGKRNHGGLGKTVLRRKEIRQLYRHAIERARAGDERATGTLLALVLGMRATKIVTRQVRDLDDEEWILGVDMEHAKTDASERGNEVPTILRPLLARLTKGKRPDQYIFGTGDKPHWRDWVRESIQRLCVSAKVRYPTAIFGATSTLKRLPRASSSFAATRRNASSSAAAGTRASTSTPANGPRTPPSCGRSAPRSIAGWHGATVARSIPMPTRIEQARCATLAFRGRAQTDRPRPEPLRPRATR